MKQIKLYQGIFLILILLKSLATFGQTEKVELSPSELMSDYKIYRTALEEAHAGLNLYITQKDLDKEFNKIEKAIASPLTKNQFYKLLLQTTARLKHGHSFLINDQPYGINYKLRDLLPNHKYFPFTLKIIDNKVYVEVDCSSKKSTRSGSELLDINGVSVSNLLTELQKYIPADGGNVDYKNFRLENFLFHYLYDLLYPNVTRYHIVSRLVNGTKSEFELDGIKPTELEEKYNAYTGHSINYFPASLKYNLIDSSKAMSYLKISSFYEGLTNRNGVEIMRFLDSTFHKVSDQHINKLIIDLRDNEGGNDYLAVVLFSYLTNKPFSQGNPTFLKSDGISVLSHAQNPDDDIVQFAAHPGDFEDKINSKFILKRQYDEISYKTFTPKQPIYTGTLIIITNGGSFSATSRFINTAAHYLQNSNRKVRFVGENYGGDDLKGFATGGGGLNFILPSSHIKLTIPIKEFTRFTTPSNNGKFILDKKINQDPKNILEDVQLKKAIRYADSL